MTCCCTLFDFCHFYLIFWSCDILFHQKYYNNAICWPVLTRQINGWLMETALKYLLLRDFVVFISINPSTDLQIIVICSCWHTNMFDVCNLFEMILFVWTINYLSIFLKCMIANGLWLKVMKIEEIKKY